MARLTPYEFQLDTIRLARDQNLLVADDCGLGKTLTAIEAAFEFKTARDPGTWPMFLVICPKKLKQQWAEQIANQMGTTDHIYILDNLAYDLKDAFGWFIIHYDALDKATYLVNQVWDVVIADEAHRLRKKRNKWSVAIKRLVASRYLALTATPMDRYPSEYWSILDFLKADQPHYHGFKAKYENWIWVHAGGKSFPIYKGTKNVEGLANLLSQVMVRHTKAEVAPQLPEHIIIPESVEMTEAQKKAYQQIDESEDLIVPVEGINDLLIQNALTKLVRLQQFSTDPLLLDSKAGSGKLEWLDEFLEDHPDKKVAVFTKWRLTAIRTAERYGAALIVGGQEPQGLQAFKEGEQNVLVGTIAGMGIGLDLPMATYSVFLDMEWSTLQMQQAYDRIHRINIKEPKITYLLISSEIDALVFRAVRDKMSQLALIMSYIQDM